MLSSQVVLCPRCGNSPGELRPVASQVFGRDTFACPSCGFLWSVGEKPRIHERRMPLSKVSLPAPVDACPACRREGVTELSVTSGGGATFYRCPTCLHVWTVSQPKSA